MKELHFQLLKQRLRQNLSQIFPLAELSGCKHFYDLDYYNTEDVRDAFIDSTGIDVMAVIEIAGKSYQQNMDLILAGEFTGLEVEGLKEWLQEQHLTVKIAIDETETVELELNEYLDDFMRCLRLTDRLDPEIKTAIQSKVPQNMRKAVSRRLLGVSAAGENKLFLLRFISEKQ